RLIASAGSDAVGAYLIGRGLPAGLYYARTTNTRGYVNEVYNNRDCCNARLGNPVSVTEGATTAGIDFSLALGGTLRGTVTDDLTGAPLSGIGVSIFDSAGRFVASGSTDMRGFYLPDGGLPAGS